MDNVGSDAKDWLTALILIAGIYSPYSQAASAQSTATVSWASSFACTSAAGMQNMPFESYLAGTELATAVAVQYQNQCPSGAAPHQALFDDGNASASAIADSTSLIVSSSAVNGTAAAQGSMTQLFNLSGQGTLTINLPYEFSTQVDFGAGQSTLTLFASWKKYTQFGVLSGGFDATPLVFNDNGLGAPNDLTSVLALPIAYDANDSIAILNFSLISSSVATEPPVETVPIPGGIVLLIPALFPLFASKKNRRALVCGSVT